MTKQKEDKASKFIWVTPAIKELCLKLKNECGGFGYDIVEFGLRHFNKKKYKKWLEKKYDKKK